ncbi:MAG: DUF4330 family protein [Ruminococcaceae bacterium]|nr:DUF4330 family protein [Oscillospiraceae bacterium]
MIIDKNGKLFGKISIIDIFIIFVIIVAGVIIGIKINSSAVRTNFSEKTYSVRVSAIKPGSAEYINKGDELYDDKGSFLGTVEEVKVSEAKTVHKLDNGQYAEVENPERVDVDITIKGKGFESDGIFYLDGKVALLAGAERFFKGSKIDFDGKILEILD